MITNSITLSIQGDFVDSFIYSGTLFIVHANSQLSTYSWKKILECATDQISNTNLKRQINSFMLDCRDLPFDFNNNSPISIEIDRETLEGLEFSTIKLNGWTTDINVYSNRLYICGEEGVDEYDLDWKTNKIIDSPPFKIWNQYAFMIAPNDFRRIAIAAGKNGVITAFPNLKYKSISSKDLSPLIDRPSSDCEWIGNNLVSNTSEGAYLSVFPSLPEKPQNPDQEYWNLLDQAKRSEPKTHPLENENHINLKYAWMAGERLLGINRQGKIYTHIETSSPDSQIQHKERYISRLTQERFLAVRAGSFGTVIEYENELVIYNESGEQSVAERPVNWRVFPRSKNYINHLHVVENDLLKIYAFDINQSNHHVDYYAIDINNII